MPKTLNRPALKGTPQRKARNKHAIMLKIRRQKKDVAGLIKLFERRGYETFFEGDVFVIARGLKLRTFNTANPSEVKALKWFAKDVSASKRH